MKAGIYTKEKETAYLVLLIKVLLSFTISSLSTDFLVVLLEGSKILTSLGEFTFFHTLADIPVDKGTLGVHQVELVVNARESLGNGSSVGNHANGTLDTGEITSRNNGRRLVVDATFESSRTPIDKLDSTLGLDGGNSSVDILGDDISAVHEAASHVLSMTRVTLSHHAGRFKYAIGNLSHGKLLVVGLLGRNHGCVGGEHEVDTRVWDQVGLEFWIVARERESKIVGTKS
jgi:hypothetical protein